MTSYLDFDLDEESEKAVASLDELSFWSAPFGTQLLDMVRYSRSMNVLDVGSGLGFPLIELAMRLGASSRVYGIDPWRAAVKRANDKIAATGVSNASVIEARGENLPFRDEKFDLITSNNGLNNVQDVRKTINEIGRVARRGAQFVFTFNTNRTFLPFYEAFRETLYQLGLQDCNRALSEHILLKRRPEISYRKMLIEAGFRVRAVHDNIFSYYFADGAAMLNHFFIKVAFLPSWKKIVSPDDWHRVFDGIEKRLNAASERRGRLELQVPFSAIDCDKL